MQADQVQEHPAGPDHRDPEMIAMADSPNTTAAPEVPDADAEILRLAEEYHPKMLAALEASREASQLEKMWSAYFNRCAPAIDHLRTVDSNAANRLFRQLRESHPAEAATARCDVHHEGLVKIVDRISELQPITAQALAAKVRVLILHAMDSNEIGEFLAQRAGTDDDLSWYTAVHVRAFEAVEEFAARSASGA